MKKRTPQQRGQVTVEAVLLSIVFAALALFVSRSFQDNRFLSSLVEGPWSYVNGMAQHGVWAPEKKAKTASPYFSPRRVSLDPKDKG